MARVIAVVVAIVEGVARAGGGPATDAYEGIGDEPVAIHALADLYVTDNRDDPASGRSTLRAFDRTADQPAIGWLRLELAHAPDRVGFRLDLADGDVSHAYFDADPAAKGHPDLTRWLSHVTQGFVTIVAGGVAIDVGKFDTPVGLEDNEAYTNWSYSRSFVYTYAEPTMHAGARATYQVTSTVAVAAFWLNGWNANLYDGSTLRSYALAVRWRPCDALELVAVDAGGLERAPASAPITGLAFRNVVDAYAIYHPLAWLGLALTADYASDRAEGGVSFYGAAGYARADFGGHFAVAVRGESLADPAGFATGTKQALAEGTATVEARYRVHRVDLQGRLEARHDHSNAGVFPRDPAVPSRAQDTFTLALLANW